MNTVKVLRVGFIDASLTEYYCEYYIDTNTISSEALEAITKIKSDYVNSGEYEIGEMEDEVELDVFTEVALLKEIEAHLRDIQDMQDEEVDHCVFTDINSLR